jgi:hypothetical protein
MVWSDDHSNRLIDLSNIHNIFSISSQEMIFITDAFLVLEKLGNCNGQEKEIQKFLRALNTKHESTPAKNRTWIYSLGNYYSIH